MTKLKCEKCDLPMALADQRCHHCGQEAPPGRSAQVYFDKAIHAANKENWIEALRLADQALGANPPLQDRILFYQRSGAWYERQAAGQVQGQDWMQAEASFRDALMLDDGNEAVHQLWISNLAKAGRGQIALDWYQKRLELNPEDDIAKRFKTVAKLTLDYKNQSSKNSYQAADEVPKSRFEKIFGPSRVNILGAAFGTLISAIAAIVTALGLVGEVEGPMALVVDPMTWVYTGAFSFVFLIILWKNR